MNDELEFCAIWGREFAQALSPVVPGLCGQDGYEVLGLALGERTSRSDLMALADEDIVRLRDAARRYLETDKIELDHIRGAVEATQWHSSDEN